MTSYIVASDIDQDKAGLDKELLEIHNQHEYDMQDIAKEIETLNIKHQEGIKQAYIKFNIPLPEKYKPPDMS